MCGNRIDALVARVERGSIADPQRTACMHMLCSSFIVIALIAAKSQGALVDRGSGLIYDTTLNVTWLQNAQPGFGQQFYYQNPWVESFSYYDAVRNQTLVDWHLPSPAQILSLYRDTLGNPSAVPYDAAHGAALNLGPFYNVATTPYQGYWTNSDLPGGYAVGFAWWAGNIWGWDEGQRLFGWPVMTGDVGVPTSAAIPAGVGATVALLGGDSVAGGVEATFGETTAGTFSAQFESIGKQEFFDRLSAGDFVFNEFNFFIPGDSIYLWDLDFTGITTDPINVTFNYDPLTISASSLRVFHFHDGMWTTISPLAVDEIQHLVTFPTDGFSSFIVGALAVPEPTSMATVGAVAVFIIFGCRRPRVSIAL